MSFATKISWTHHSFSIAWGCTKYSEGCSHCYADKFSTRAGYDIWGEGKPRRIFGEEHWRQPITWNRYPQDHVEAVAKVDAATRQNTARPTTSSAAALEMAQRKLTRLEIKLAKAGITNIQNERQRVFCSSMADIFEDHPTIDQERAKLWGLIRATPHLDWMLLTKRAERMASQLPADWGDDGYPNVWMGVSIESGKYAARADVLRNVPAKVRFISYEPAIGPLEEINLEGISLLIFGGESGAQRRGMDLKWAEEAHEKCRASGTAFFF